MPTLARTWQVTRHGLALFATAAALGCASNRPRVLGSAPPGLPVEPGPSAADAVTLYNSAGLIATGGMVPFVGTVRYLATQAPETTLVLLAVSLPATSLTFFREEDRYRASYSVSANLYHDSASVGQILATEIVRVSSARETTRADESIVFQKYLRLAPGKVAMTLTVRDINSNRSTSTQTTLDVPGLRATSLSSPIALLENGPRAQMESLPDLVASPQATAVFNKDSVISFYVEGYPGDTGNVLAASVVTDKGGIVWADTVRLVAQGPVRSVVVAVPVESLSVGPATLVLRRPTERDSITAPLFVAFAPDLPLASFDAMLSYLRLFASAQRLQSLRDTVPARRPEAWRAFVRQSDPVPSTSQHEGLEAYFERIRLANERYREDGGTTRTPADALRAGWLTDRGRVFVALGEPDIVGEPRSAVGPQRSRTQTWEYTRLPLVLRFVDETGFGRWRLMPESDVSFRNQLIRQLVR